MLGDGVRHLRRASKPWPRPAASQSGSDCSEVALLNHRSPPVHLSSFFWFPSLSPNRPTFSFSSLSSFSPLLPPSPPPLAGFLSPTPVIAVYGSASEDSPRDGTLFFWPACASGLVSLCKYLHGGIIDGPTHFEVERRSTSGHIRAKNDTECDLEWGGGEAR